MATPSAMSRCPSDRSCSASGTSAPPGRVRAGRRAWCSTMRASSPAASSCRPAATSCRVDRIASAGEVVVAGVALVEDEVEHLRTVRSLRAGRGGRGDGALGPADPLRHRRLGNQVGLGDLAGGEPADGPQRQRHGRGRGQRRVASTGTGGGACRRPAWWGPTPGSASPPFLAAVPGRIGAHGSRNLPRATGDQPTHRVTRDASSGPAWGRASTGPPARRPRPSRSRPRDGRGRRGPAGSDRGTAPRSGRTSLGDRRGCRQERPHLDHS